MLVGNHQHFVVFAATVMNGLTIAIVDRFFFKAIVDLLQNVA